MHDGMYPQHFLSMRRMSDEVVAVAADDTESDAVANRVSTSDYRLAASTVEWRAAVRPACTPA